MPVYEYECGACRKRSDVLLRSYSAAEPKVCPECGSSDFHRTIAQVQVRKSAESRLAEIPGKYEKMVDEAGKDLSMENLIKNYRLDESRTDTGKGAPDW